MPGTFFIVELQKGQIYQYAGQADAGGNGVELTGSKIESIPNASGIKKSIAVFAGTAGTSGENSSSCSGTSRDLDMQQCFPENSWGTRYATVPFATASGTSITPSVFAETVYKIVAKDTNTLVTINGGVAIAVSIGTAYKFSNAVPNFIQSNKPIMVGQFMTSANCASGDGDPEMIYLSPLEQAVSQVGFYRNTQQYITTNYVNIIIPDSGLASLAIDASLASLGSNTYIISQPNLPGYKIVVKGWAAAKAQCSIKSNAPFSAITYGLGGAESYGYNCGASFKNINQYFDISGRIISPIHKPVKKVIVVPSSVIINDTYSDTNGAYNFSIINNNIVKPTKNNDITKANGVTSVDALLTQRHILNVTKLNSPYKIIAADINGDKSINSVDVLRIKRLILGTDTTFNSTTKGNRLWEFVDSAYIFADTTNPFPFKDSISFTNLTSNKTNQTFIGVKLGDVNYDWNPAVAKGASIYNVELIIDNAAIKVDKQLSTVNYQLPIKVKNFKDIAAMQYTLHFDNTKYEFVNLEGFKNLQGFENNATQANSTGNIAMLWTDKNAEAKTLEDGTELFVLILRSTVDSRQSTDLALTIDNSITEIEAWDKDFIQHNIILSQKSKVETQNISEVWSVSPNPTSGAIKVSIASKQSKTVSFELTDAQGKTIFKQAVELKKGDNNFTLNLKQNGNISTGIYFLKAVGIEGENVKRMTVR